MIAELLGTGKNNTTTGKELATLLNCDIRHITAQIEKERRQGVPICANMNYKPGYYLAADEKELQDYCDLLHHRAAELYKTRGELLKTCDKIAQDR